MHGFVFRPVTRSFTPLLYILFLATNSAQAVEFKYAAGEEWSGTYRCGPIAKDRAQWPGYTAHVKLVLDGGMATILKESARIKETMAGTVSDDGRLRLEGKGFMKAESGSPKWRYRFEGRFEGSQFAASGAMLSANGRSKLRECTMTLARIPAVGAKPAQARPSIKTKEAGVAPAAAAPAAASVPSTVTAATETPAEKTAPGASIESPPHVKPMEPQLTPPGDPAEPAPMAAARGRAGSEKDAARAAGRYSGKDRALLALFLGVAAAGAGILVYDWRRPSWLAPHYAIAALIATAMATSAVAFYVLL